jgi:hypothetical protein
MLKECFDRAKSLRRNVRAPGTEDWAMNMSSAAIFLVEIGEQMAKRVSGRFSLRSSHSWTWKQSPFFSPPSLCWQ